MRHGKKINHLGRKSAHRKAMLSNMACSLIEHKRINTTVAKAKALQKYIEPIITRAKDDSTHSQRMVFRYLQSKEAVNILFTEVGPKITDRPGGYTRIIKTGFRLGDGADTAMIELVDFNEIYSAASPAKKTRRGRRKKKGDGDQETTETKVAPKEADAVEQSQEVVQADANEAKLETAPAEPIAEAVEQVVEDTSNEAQTEEAPKSEETSEEVEHKVEPIAEADSGAIDDAEEESTDDKQDKEKDA